MTLYSPLVILRSDGVTQYIHNGVPTPNQPKPADLDDTPNAQGQVSVYKKLAPDDMKALQWRRKLAGMLLELLPSGGAKHRGRDAILREFPEGYVLWQQLKYTEGPNATSTTKKTHATAGAERNDAYLFGHPGGRSKKFRSPQEFFPHLLWLATDQDGDPRNCSCKLCFPEKRNGGDNGGEDDDVVEIKDDMKREEDIAKFPISLTTSRAPNTSLSANPPVLSGGPETSKPMTATALKPSPEQEFDSRAGGAFIYRPGELVWFNKGTAWGLAVVCRRQMIDGPQYLLQPLSNPLQHGEPQVRKHDKMRPWLAWSVPPTTYSQLRNKSFDQVPWDRVVRGDFREPTRNGDAIVDGSILAAKAVDSSYSLFDRLNIPTAAGETRYNGMFVGGEKVWVGEPVRLAGPNTAGPNDAFILIIHQLIEKLSGVTQTLTIVGDVYKFVTMPSTYMDRNSWPVQDLPARLQADLRFRNEVADNAKKNLWHEWRLLEAGARKSLTDIRGRWYEVSALLPTLRGEMEAQAEYRSGVVMDVSSSMNARMDGSRLQAIRKKNRADALGASVPKDLKISKGLNGPLEDSQFGAEVPANAAKQEIPQSMDWDGTIDQNAYFTSTL